MYAEFILGKHVNYFDILEFQGVVHGIPQDREGARTDPNHVPRPPHTPKLPWVYSPSGPMIDDTHEALFDLVDTLLQHGTAIQGNVGQGVRTYEGGPSHSKEPFIDHTKDAKHSERRVTPHPCTTCGGIFYGFASEFCDDVLLRYVSKTHYFHIIFCVLLQFSIISQFISI